VAGTIDKLQPTPVNYTIGDTVTYDIVITLPEGDTNDLVVTDALLGPCIDAITAAARTGKIGDGKIFVTPVEQVVRIRTGETDEAAV